METAYNLTRGQADRRRGIFCFDKRQGRSGIVIVGGVRPDLRDVAGESHGIFGGDGVGFREISRRGQLTLGPGSTGIAGWLSTEIRHANAEQVRRVDMERCRAPGKAN